MFLCETCLRAGYTNEPSMLLSRGPCEGCGKTAACSDIPSAHLDPRPIDPRPRKRELKPRCQRCTGRPGNPQPSDGDAATLFATAAHMNNSEFGDIILCTSCVQTLEYMALRAAKVRS